MSQYTSVFLRKNNEFVEVSCTSRSSIMSHIFEDYAPWEKIQKISADQLHSLLYDYREEERHNEQYIESKQEEKKLIATFNNSASEKLDAIAECDFCIKDCKESQDELRAALARLEWLVEIAENKYNNVDVYVGVEVSTNVTENDIV